MTHRSSACASKGPGRSASSSTPVHAVTPRPLGTARAQYHLRQMMVVLDGRPVQDSAAESVLGFLFVYTLSFALLAMALALTPLAAQTPFAGLDSHPTGAKPAAVAYLFPEQITVVADQPSWVDLHFKVSEGLHVNSHLPHSEYLIPTTFKAPPTAGVRLADAVFPPGQDFALDIGPDAPKEKLSVYTGEFTVRAQLVAGKGEHLLEATLRYQACNNEACMPPHSIPGAIDVIAK